MQAERGKTVGYERARQVFESVGNIIDNQEKLQSRLKKTGMVKVKKGLDGVTI